MCSSTRPANCSVKRAETSASSWRSICAPRCTTDTRHPSDENTWPISAAMNPPPRMIRCSGTLSIRMIVSEVWNGVASSPGMSGSLGRAPAASTKRSERTVEVDPSAAVTRSSWSPTKRASPSNTVTWS